MIFLPIQFGGYVPQNSECKFFVMNMEAIATFMFYMNRLLAMSFDDR
jgi:hypothetical protein